MNENTKQVMELWLANREDEAKQLMKQMVRESGGFTKLSKKVNMQTTNIHRMLSPKGNPTSRHLFLLLRNI